MKAKTLIFIDDLAKENYPYAHPMGEYWGESALPLLMKEDVTANILRKTYPKIVKTDWYMVKLVTVEILTERELQVFDDLNQKINDIIDIIERLKAFHTLDMHRCADSKDDAGREFNSTVVMSLNTIIQKIKE